MDNKKIAIVGGGNLGSSIARGLIHTGLRAPEEVFVTRRRSQLLASLSKLGINTGTDNVEAVSKAAIVFLAVKPYQVKDVLDEIKSSFSSQTIIISLATGIDNCTLLEWCGGKHTVYRAMPNTAVAIGQSMTCLSGINSSEEQDEIIKSLFEKLGSVQFIPEELMAGATVLAACGIAFALRFVRAATQGGIEIGFGSELALKIASQTVKGAAHLLIEGDSHPEAEIDKVTTPRGITISGLNEMEHQGFSSSLIKGLMASFQKIENGSKK